MVRLISPEDGASVSLLTTGQRDFIRLFDEGTLSYDRGEDFGFTRENEPYDFMSRPAPVAASFICPDPDEAVLTVSESFDLSDPVPFLRTCHSVSDGVVKVSLFNLKPGKEYFWRVACGDELSEIRSFKTNRDEPRFLYVPEMENVRDIGGYVTGDGRRVKQGLVFRGQAPDFRVEYGRRIGLTEKGAEHFFGDLCVRNVIDLCGDSEDYNVSDGVGKIHISSFDYTDALEGEQKEYLRQYLETVLDLSVYPFFVHCAAGADRTGTAIAFLEGILGMSDRDILLDYYVTALSLSPEELENWFTKKDFEAMFESLGKRYPFAGSYSERIEAFVLDLGIPGSALRKLRDFLLE
ncbi:MAG: tyrosine-protein phosphatase [Clostridia bacterium]|nr:tyrosine-protein phosphatase [Clostridia bacterium]